MGKPLAIGLACAALVAIAAAAMVVVRVRGNRAADRAVADEQSRLTTQLRSVMDRALSSPEAYEQLRGLIPGSTKQTWERFADANGLGAAFSRTVAAVILQRAVTEYSAQFRQYFVALRIAQSDPARLGALANIEAVWTNVVHRGLKGLVPALPSEFSSRDEIWAQIQQVVDAYQQRLLLNVVADQSAFDELYYLFCSIRGRQRLEQADGIPAYDLHRHGAQWRAVSNWVQLVGRHLVSPTLQDFDLTIDGLGHGGDRVRAIRRFAARVLESGTQADARLFEAYLGADPRLVAVVPDVISAGILMFAHTGRRPSLSAALLAALADPS